MTIILRLEGLDAKAGTEDIRTFFECLHIPNGGVYIVGGLLREAFVAFNTERDAQYAMRLTGNFLKESKVTLHISSMEELEHKLKLLLKKKTSPLTVKRPRQHQAANSTWPHDGNTSNQSPSTACSVDPDGANLPSLNEQHVYSNTANIPTSNAQSLDSSTAFLLGVYTVLQGLQVSHQSEVSNAVATVDFPKADSMAMLPDEVITPEPTLASRPGYVRLFGLPASTTKEDICHFFRGLTVQEAIVNVLLGSKRACLVKFANMRDACDALCFNQQSLGPICVEVRGATEKLWDNVLQECGNASDLVERWEPLKNPLHESSKHKDKSTSTLRIKRRSINRLPSKPPKKPKLDADSGMPISPYMEHVVMVSNLPKEMTKTELKELFACPNIARKNVLHLLDKAGCRTDTSFLIFHCTENYNYAMNLNGCYVGSNPINISSITKAMMSEMMWKTHPLHCLKTYPRKMPEPKRKPGPVDTFEVPPGVNQDLEAQTCLFARNMPVDVRKRHIKDLFSKYKLTKGNIIILHDRNGKGLGEAVVQFKSEKLAALARSIHRNNFLGFNVILTPINVRQMMDIMARNS